MKTSSNKNFEQQWQQKFKETSQQPPADMWDRIEASLDEKAQNKSLFLLWGTPTYVISGIAATLILAICGWFLLSKPEINSGNQQISKQKSEQVKTLQNESAAVKVETKNEANATIETESNVAFAEENQFKINSETAKSSRIVFEREDDSEPSMIQKRFASTLNKMTAHSYDEYPVRYILKRNKLAFVEPHVETDESTPKHKKSLWVGLISGLSPFKPNFQTGNLDQLASANVESFSSNDANFNIQRNPQSSQGSAGSINSENSFVVPIGSPLQQFTNGRAFNLGIQAGKQLTKRFAIESGVRYIQGNSPVNSNVYTLNELTGEVNAFVQDYITQDKTLNNAVVASAETLNNSYEYLSFPVQLAYGIPLLNKLNVEIIGGVSADMFLQNTLQSETTDVASLNASNSAFRAVGVSGLGGVRLNYLLDEKWELTVGSAFQQALVSNFEAGTSAKLRPQMIGVNYGVNYHF